MNHGILFLSAIEEDNPEILKLITHYDETDMNVAAAHGSIKCLKYLHSRACVAKRTANEVGLMANTLSSSTLFAAINSRAGNLDCIKYLLENSDITFNEHLVLLSAILNKNVSVLDYLYNYISPAKNILFTHLAAGYDLSILMYLIGKGEDYDEKTIYMAIKCNKLDCVKYLFGIECKYDSEIWSTYNREILLYLYKKGASFMPEEKYNMIVKYISQWYFLVNMIRDMRSYIPADIYGIINNMY